MAHPVVAVVTFESSVNLQGNETKTCMYFLHEQFESSVNLQGNETMHSITVSRSLFESSVNLQGNETQKAAYQNIQKV